MKRKICVITGTRADYGILYSVLRKIEESKKLKLYLVVTCMHLMKEFGYTINGIEKDGFNIYEKINISYQKDTGEAMAFSVGKAVSLFSMAFAKLKPDIVVVLGDRGEMLAAAIAASYLNIPVAHIHGGEVSGHIDGQLRHAITKLAHIHFPATLNAKRRIIKLGEESWRVFLVGAPALDRIKNEKLPNKKYLLEKYNLKPNLPIVLLVQNPVITQINNAGKQIRITLEALKHFPIQILIIYPNADAGGRKMIKVIKSHKKFPLFKSLKNMPHKDYLGLMKIASLLVGNSSSGIAEAPSFRLPVINIGIRQKGREKSNNVIDVPHDKTAIIKSVNKAFLDSKFKNRVERCKNIYGDGCASTRIVRILSSIKLDRRILEKQMTY